MSDPEPVEYTSPHPECRVTATTEPFGMIRLDVSRDRAAIIAKRVDRILDAHPGEGLVDIHFQMQRDQYSHLSENLGQILETDADGVQVILSPEPEISVMVILSREQIQQLERTTARALQATAPDAYAWEVSVSESGAQMLVQQLAAAVKGEDEPMDAVDTDAVGGPDV